MLRLRPGTGYNEGYYCENRIKEYRYITVRVDTYYEFGISVRGTVWGCTVVMGSVRIVESTEGGSVGFCT
jgi:hypothetical protein